MSITSPRDRLLGRLRVALCEPRVTPEAIRGLLPACPLSPPAADWQELVVSVIEQDRADILALLLPHVDMSCDADKKGKTLLMAAASLAFPDCVQLLLPLSEPLRSQPGNGETALSLAAGHENKDPNPTRKEQDVERCISLLLPVSNVNWELEDDFTALDAAVEANKPGRAVLLAVAPYLYAEILESAFGFADAHHHWACLDALAEFVNPALAEEAFSRQGEFMPIYCAKKDAKALEAIVFSSRDDLWDSSNDVAALEKREELRPAVKRL